MVYGQEDQVLEARDKLVSSDFLNPQDSSSRQRTIDWSGPVHEPRKVLCKLCDRQDHDTIYHFNLRGSRDTNLVFHQSGSDAIILYENMPACALDKVVFFCV